MALNTLKCNRLTAQGLKGLNVIMVHMCGNESGKRVSDVFSENTEVTVLLLLFLHHSVADFLLID